MNTAGYMYLHRNGQLIFKPDPSGDCIADFRESDLVRMFWHVSSPMERLEAWTILVEAHASGAKHDRIISLAKQWNCTDDDAFHYCEWIGAQLAKDGNQFMAARKDFINIHESPVGFGDTALEALSELAVALDFQPTKMWGASFQKLLEMPATVPA